ncbi:TetR/AcrR family transcriptional regulator [Streptomyces oceani]|uniref:TetR family transcriptional regulator n=1 Tax=Streptomyces oceani TaxID=1075402 RepID=A0A1E7KKZ9_9ACTN|nr:TetR/AcrR family transcriptional regulator [Streptomyces oceani]OEV04608.1 TetR family transcriptional regulator [Streptomyces oceani]
MAGRSVREEKVGATKEAILTAAERLFAERGVHNVSNRQISDAAGQGNTTAVNYHFGNKTDLVRAISRRHTEQIELIRDRLVVATQGSTTLRDWVACMVRPVTEHLDSLGSPTWYARFNAQVTADPALYEAIATEPASAPSLRTLLDGLNARLPDLPPEVQAARGAMARHLIVQMCVERERALASGESYPPGVWTDTADLLIDALTGLWDAPVSGPAG